MKGSFIVWDWYWERHKQQGSDTVTTHTWWSWRDVHVSGGGRCTTHSATTLWCSAAGVGPRCHRRSVRLAGSSWHQRPRCHTRRTRWVVLHYTAVIVRRRIYNTQHKSLLHRLSLYTFDSRCRQMAKSALGSKICHQISLGRLHAWVDSVWAGQITDLVHVN